jgi:hypothetical protein
MSVAILARKAEDAEAATARAPSRGAFASLRVSQPNDAYEQQADRVADAATAGERVRPQWSFARMNIEPLSRKCASGDARGAQGKAWHCDSPLEEEAAQGPQRAEPVAEKETPGAAAPREAPPNAIGESAPVAEPLQSGGATSAPCPAKTVVEKVTNKMADGQKYRTGMGAVAVIAVQPDSQTWDGASITESFKTPTSDCPKEFGINPCSGNSVFPVGAGKHSPVFGAIPATRNRFPDFHETRWNSCTIACEQQYSCGGKVIGTHTITRTFTKGKIGSVDVTFVSVAKT